MERKEKLSFEDALSRAGFGLYSYLMTVLAGLVVISQVCVAYGTTIIIPASTCELETTGAQRGVLAAVPVVGLILGGVFWGYLADKRGRKPMLITSLLAAATVNALASISVNWVMLMILQFLATLLSSGQYPLSLALVSESVPLMKRNVVVLLVTSIFLLAQGVMAVLAIPIIPLTFSYYLSSLNIYWNSWRTLLLLYSAPSLVTATIMFFVNESPKFLFAKGRENEAKDVLHKIHKMNHIGSSPLLEIDGIDQEKEKETEVPKAEMSQLFKPPLLKNLIIISLLYICQQIGAFMVWLPTIANQFVEIIQTGEGSNLTLCAIIRESFDAPPNPDIAPCALNTTAMLIVLAVGALQSVMNGLLSLIVNRVGRRNLSMMITACCGALGIIVNLIPNAYGSVIVFVLSLTGMIVVGLYAAITVATFPTHLRALAITIAMTGGRLGTFVSVQILNFLLETNCEAGFYLFSSIYAVNAIIAAFLADDRASQVNKVSIFAYPILPLNFSYWIDFLGINYRPWRLLALVMFFPCAFTACLLQLFHESPKFLVSVGQNEKALEVLKKIYACNSGNDAEDFPVKKLTDMADNSSEQDSILSAMWQQTAALFRFPLLKDTLKLFYLVCVIYMTGSGFILWLPYIMNNLFSVLKAGGGEGMNLCTVMRYSTDTAVLSVNGTVIQEVCNDTIQDTTLLSAMTYGAMASSCNLVLSLTCGTRKRFAMMCILLVAAVSAVLLNLVANPIAGGIFFFFFLLCALTMGILSVYFVELYPTSLRGMASCLSIMLGRSSAFLGVNAIGALISVNCEATFYVWAVLLLSAVALAWFLPKDKQPNQ